MLHCNTVFTYSRYWPPSDTIMSKQLAISTAFSVFAMAAMVLFNTPDNSGRGGGDAGVTVVEAGLNSIDLPGPRLIP